MFTNEEKIFIKILSDWINRLKTSFPPEISLPVLYDYGEKHGVLGIIYQQTKLSQFQLGFLSTVHRNVNRKRFIESFTKSLKIPYFIVKGGVVADLYPNPLLRTMGDIDIVVERRNRNLVHEKLISEGFTCVNQPPDREWQYKKDSLEIEIHFQLLYKGNTNNRKQDLFFNNNFWNYVENNFLDWNFHFLYLLAHLRKHFMNEGAGLRLFMDLAVVVQNVELDWEWIERIADEIELLSFLKTTLAFCSRWFAIDVPIQTIELEDDFFESSTAKIIKDGVFGFHNDENGGSLATNIIRKKGKIGLIKYAINQVFPTYYQLCNFSDCAFVKGRPLLVPVAWVYRLATFDNKKATIRRFFNNIRIDNTKIAKREMFYKQWGI